MANRKGRNRIRNNTRRRKRTTKHIVSRKPEKVVHHVSRRDQSNPHIVQPLEILLPKIEEGLVFVPSPFWFNSRFIQSQEDSHEVLRLRMNGNGREVQEVPLYDSSEFFLIRSVSEKDNLSLSPTIFQGEIGERVMRATLEQMLRIIKNRNPRFEYNILRGTSREVIRVHPHYLLAFGKFDNVYLYETESEWIGGGEDKTKERLHNPLFSRTDNDKLAGTVFNKERYRGCFKPERAEMDALITWEYEGRRGLIVCESKTGRKARIGSHRRFRSEEESLSYDYDKRIAPLLEIFPGYEISYLIMGCKGAVYFSKTKQMSQRVVSVFDFFTRTKNLPVIVLGFDFNSNTFAEQGEFVYQRYLGLLSQDRNWKTVSGGSYDSKQGLVSLRLGSGEKIVLRRDSSNPELYHKVTPKGKI